ncbi:MAG: sugar transferase [Schaedlerella sp.]|nr:sugar transferase [Schaedlerella sp.]
MKESQKKYIKIKDKADRILAVGGLIVLAPVYLGIIAAIKLEDGWEAPVFFSQKRVGIHKSHFQLYKFRSMKLDTPHDTPTHLLKNPEQYITKVGKFLRKTSLDELPQLYNIVRGDMSVVGPRPALWNQYDLIDERDKYEANDIKPGLTGWAQINGRDELEIEDKARADGYYVNKFGPAIDIRCFLGTIGSVFRSEGVVEGGTGELKNKKKKVMMITNHSYMFWRFRKELTEELLKDSEVIISTPYVGHEKDLEALGCKMIETDVDRRGINPVTDLKLFRFYFNLLKNEKPDMVITYSIKPNIYAGFACRILKISYCVNVQGLGTAFQKRGISEIVTIMYKAAVKNAKTVFFENTENARIFRDKKITPALQQTILSGAGINLDEYAYVPYPENEKIHFLYLGRIMKEKGIDELFYTMKKLHEKYGEKVVLDLVGFFEDEYKEQVEQLVKDGIAVFHGFQENPRPYYAQADCVVLPSYHEGLSNVLLEAAAMGRAVITSNIPGCREAVCKEKSGLLCKMKDKKDLLNTMEQFVQFEKEERETMGRIGRKHMEKVFSKEKIVKKTMEEIWR